jgi:gliding motility-associated-like protein
MIANKQNCIDADTLQIEIQPLKKRNEERNICRGQSTIFNGTSLDEAGQYEYRTLGCDSLVTLHLIVHSPDSIMLPRQEICKGDSLYFLDNWWKEEINASIKLKNKYECDSIITFELRVIDTIKTNQSLSICDGDSIRIFDEWISEGGKYEKSFQTVRGCDSLAVIQLMVNSISVNSEVKKICKGDSIFVFNEWKKEAGIYTQKYQSINGCDSTEQVQLIVEELRVRSDSIKICEGDSIEINDVVYDKEGDYQTLLSSAENCDTIYKFNLQYSPLITKTENYTICEGDSILINGIQIKKEETIKYTIKENHCKTEITAYIIVKPSTLNIQQYTLCPDESITINNEVINESKDIEYTLQNADGCDSIIQAKVTKLTWPEPPVVELDCEENVYHATIDAVGWDILWSNGATINTTSITTNPSNVKVSNANNCEKIFDIEMASLPDLKEIPSFDEKKVTEGESISMVVPLYTKEWDIRWLPATAVSCDTCFETTIAVDTNTSITIELTHLNGCKYIRTFIVIVEREKVNITIPNIINTSSTSNNTWTVIIPEGYKIEEVKVFDRWGSVLYNHEGKTEDDINWDGKLNGSYVVPGVYVYYIRLLNAEGKMEILKGDVTVVR